MKEDSHERAIRIAKEHAIMKEALEFYGSQNLYFKRKEKIDLNKTTAIFKGKYRENNDITKPNIYESEVYECAARLKLDQGKRARQALAQLKEIKNE